jgi:radical SAM superfamily enzyme YgiQ (UPF0313 family)
MERRERDKSRERLSGEQGTIFKDWGGRLRVALIYPNTYYVGMSNLGLHSIYGWINQQPDLVCERAFLPDDLRTGPDTAIVSLESGRPLRDFDVVAFTVPFELDYPGIPGALKASGIPVFSSERGGRFPLIIGGGAALSANPEPAAPFFDAIAIGEAEPILPGLFSYLLQADFAQRDELLTGLAALEGVYVPSLYDLTPGKHDEAIPHPRNGFPSRIRRQIARNIDAFDTTSVIVASDTEFSGSYLIEIARGCGHGCNFCLAGHTFRPVRERSAQRVIEAARRGLELTDRIGLVGSAVSDYRELEYLVSQLKEMGARLSASSLRVQTLTDFMLDALVGTGGRTVTIAPEAGNERMRTVINKHLTEDQIMTGVDMAACHKVPELKLYYMIGLPGETIEDVGDIISLTLRVQERFRLTNRVGRVRAGVSAFVPKAHTPFQFAAMMPVSVLSERLDLIKKRLSKQGVAVSEESARWAEVQGVLARGDRRLAPVLASMDGRSSGEWSKGIRAAGLNPASYTGERSADETFPWEVIEAGPKRETLWRLWEKARAHPAF